MFGRRRCTPYTTASIHSTRRLYPNDIWADACWVWADACWAKAYELIPNTPKHRYVVLLGDGYAEHMPKAGQMPAGQMPARPMVAGQMPPAPMACRANGRWADAWLCASGCWADA